MADITFNPVAGAPFIGPTIMKDCTGTGGAYAPTSMDVAGYIPLLSLNGVSATGPGVMLDNQGVRNNHSLVVTASAGVTGGVVNLQGSQDNVNWVGGTTTGIVTAITLTTPGTFLTTASLTPYRYLRAYITTVISGGTVIAYIASAG